jgi:guanosine-3',5'-bis(diphosphate) 3'-pyrophosphohydrolase
MTTELLQKAMSFALAKHSGQTRKSWPVPYVFHVMDVTYQLGKLGITDENTLCGAILHDTLEDTVTTSQELFDGFGTKVQQIVEQLTCLENQDKVLYIESFGDMDQTYIEALAIKLADRTCNIQDCLAAGKNKWAKNMFAKGKVLWDYVEERKSEIETVYGKVVTSNILWWARKKRKKFGEL